MFLFLTLNMLLDRGYLYFLFSFLFLKADTVSVSSGSVVFCGYVKRIQTFQISTQANNY